MTPSNPESIDLRMNGSNDEQEAAQDLPSLLSPGDVVMLVTDSSEGLQSRPITCAEVIPSGIRCLIDQTATWVGPMTDGERPINVSYADTKGNSYLSLTGVAQVVRGKPAVDRLWSPIAEAFFDGPDDPRAAVLDIAMSSGEWWSGPSGKVSRVISLVRAAVTDQPGSVGEHGPVA